jgi:predicted nuclease of predicted toxin-antitoxin system
MKLFLDQGLPRSTVSHLLKHGIPSVHAGDIGLGNASDASILERSRKEGWIVATLDADFHALLALSGATVPSVIRVRIEGLRAESMAKLLSSVLEVCAQDLNQGAVVSVTESGIRIRHLPLLR